MEQATVDRAETVLDIVADGKHRRMGIDGVDGVGKSTLARYIGERVGVPIIELDNYLEKNRGGFVDYLRYEDLGTALEEESFVVEGVCLLEVLDRCVREVDLLIYIQRFAAGMWSDESTCDSREDVEIVLERERDNLAALSKFEASQEGTKDPKRPAELTEVSEEIIRYHDRYHPHNRADVLYQRTDC